MATQLQNPVRPVSQTPPTGPEEPRPGIDQIREIAQGLLQLLQRQRGVFFAISALTGTGLLLAVLLQTPIYEATSLLLVKFGREVVYQPEVGGDKALSNRDKETVMNSELAILRSRPVMRKVVEAVGISVLYPDLGATLEELEQTEGAESEVSLLRARAAERLNASITAQALPDADVLKLSMQHPDPLVAEQTVEALVDGFVEAHLTAYGEPEIVNFLDDRVAAYLDRLDESERRLQEFETAHAAFALESPQMTLMQWRDETLREISEVENQMAALRLRHLEDPTVTEAQSQLMHLQVEAEQLEGELLEDTKTRMTVVRRIIARRKAEVNRELAAMEEKHGLLLAKLEGTEGELRQFPTLSADYRRLRRERDADEQQYATYQQRLRDARLSAEMDSEKLASINVIQPASTAPAPVWPPSKTTSVPIALFLALVSGALAAVLVDRLGAEPGRPWLDVREAGSA